MTLKDVGRELKALRENRAMTQAELARALGIKQPNVAEMEAGKRQIGGYRDGLIRELGQRANVLCLYEEAFAATRRALWAKIEQIITEIVAQSYPKPVAYWTGDPADVERAAKELEARAGEFADKDWSAVLAPTKVAKLAGIDVDSDEFELVHRLCRKWVDDLTP